MSPLKPSCSTNSPECFNINEAQIKHIKNNYIKIIEVLKEEIKKSLKENTQKNEGRKQNN